MSTKDWLAAASMYAAGLLAVAGLLIGAGFVANVVKTLFCIGYGC